MLMQINKREASFLITSLEAAIKKSKEYHRKIEEGEIPNSDPSTFQLSKSFNKEREELLDKLTRFCEEQS